MMKIKKILRILDTEPDPSIRFEVLEKFAAFATSDDDVRSLITVLRHDDDPCVRHEAAAQLFRIEGRAPHLLANLREEAIGALLDGAHEDHSIVVRHECIEALGYLSGEATLEQLRGLTLDQNTDIRSTALIAFRTAKRRIMGAISARDISDHLIENWVDTRVESQPSSEN